MDELEGVGSYVDDLAQALAAVPPLWKREELFKEPKAVDSEHGAGNRDGGDTGGVGQ